LLIASAESHFSLSPGVVNMSGRILSGRISWDGWNITHYLSLSDCLGVLGRSNPPRRATLLRLRLLGAAPATGYRLSAAAGYRLDSAGRGDYHVSTAGLRAVANW